MNYLDIKYGSDVIYNLFFKKDYFKSRVALINYLKKSADNVYAVASAADILIYLLRQTYSSNEKDLVNMKGWIIRPYQQIEIETGCPDLSKHYYPIKLLIETNLIQKARGPQNKSKFKINNDNLVEALSANLQEWKEEREEYYKVIEEQRKEREERKGKFSIKDWSGMGEIAREAIEFNSNPNITQREVENYKALPDYKLIQDANFTGNELIIIDTVSSLYKEVFEEDYPWTYGDFNSLNNFFNQPQFFTHDNKFRDRDKLRMKEGMEQIKDGKLDYLKRAHLSKKIIMGYQGILGNKEKK